jgi:sterol 3beta-glucosyltransferase
MHLTLIALGSRGDVQPYLALAIGLQRAGMRVRLATHAEFLPLIEGWGLEFAPVRGNPGELLDQDRAQTMLGSGENVGRFLWQFGKLLEPYARQIADDCSRAVAGTDALILSNLGMIPGFHLLAEAQGIAYCTALLQPITPTRAFPSIFFPDWPVWLPIGRGAYNRWSHQAFRTVFGAVFGGIVPMIRRELGLPPIARRVEAPPGAPAPLLYGFSPSVIPPPTDWAPHIHVTGYWVLPDPAEWAPPPALQAFLSAGPPPVYVGFGSMRNRDPVATTALVVEALARAGQRGVLLVGKGAMCPEGLPDTLFPVASTSHSWLLPQMAAVVHHGGAGTTAAALRAGVPSFAVPFFADQPGWARTAHRLGVGPRPIPRRELTAARLAEAITQAVTDPAMRACAASLGARIRAEDGVGVAVEHIIRHLTHTGV